MNSYTKLTIGLFCALGLSLSACGNKEEKAKATPEVAKAKADVKSPAAPVETAKPVVAEPVVAAKPVVEADPKAMPKLVLSSKDTDKDFQKSLGDGKITAFGKEFAAKELCNENTIYNPDTVEVFETGTPDQLVILCPGGLDGETNVVTLFGKDVEPRSAKVSPPDSSHRIEDETLTSTVEKLIGTK